MGSSKDKKFPSDKDTFLWLEERVRVVGGQDVCRCRGIAHMCEKKERAKKPTGIHWSGVQKRHGDVWTRASKGVRSQDDGKRESKEEGRERESATCTMARSGENGME